MNEAHIQLEGNIGSDPELKTFDNGNTVAEFSVAVTGRKKVGDEWKDTNTTWFRVAAWNRLADHAMDLSKGKRVFITGIVVLEEWKTAEKSGTTLKVTADRILLVPTKEKTAKPAAGSWKSTSDNEPPF